MKYTQYSILQSRRLIENEKYVIEKYKKSVRHNEVGPSFLSSQQGGWGVGVLPVMAYKGRTKREKSKDYRKADQNNVYCFFITIFRVVIPAFFRFTDVTEFMIGITIVFRNSTKENSFFT